MLNELEIKWINDYHSRIWKKLNPLVNETVKKWLKHATRKI